MLIIVKQSIDLLVKSMGTKLIAYQSKSKQSQMDSNDNSWRGRALAPLFRTCRALCSRPEKTNGGFSGSEGGSEVGERHLDHVVTSQGRW